jgi:hypothetical protein
MSERDDRIRTCLYALSTIFDVIGIYAIALVAGERKRSIGSEKTLSENSMRNVISFEPALDGE